MSGVPAMFRRPTTVAGALALSGALFLAGCTQSLPVPEAEPAVVGAVVTEEQEAQILGRVSEAIGRATANRDVAALDARTTGPAKKLRTSQIKVAALRGDDDLVTNLPMSMQAVLLPSEAGWPRTSLAVSRPSDDGLTPVLYAFEQRSARSDYKLWGWAQLLPRVTLPRFASTDAGSEAVRADDAETLAMAPLQAVKAYAALLSDDSGATDGFEDDDLRRLLRNQERKQTAADGWKQADGRYSYVAKPDAQAGVRAMRTVDGGAVVLGALDSTLGITLQECAEISKASLTENQQVLFGDQAVGNVLRTRFVDMVALHVPAAGSRAPVRLVGFDHVAVHVDSAGDTSGCGG